MFFKKVFYLFFLCTLSQFSFGVIENATCLKQMKAYYPYLMMGQLHWDKQERFFRCVHDSLELIVVNKIFTHTPTRDHFTKEEIFKMFHIYFKLDVDLSEELVDHLFLIKHFAVGGEKDKLRDEELRGLYELVNTYRDFYYIIHKRIPTLLNIFDTSSRHHVSEQDFQFTLSKIQEGFRYLTQTYKKKGITYRLSDFNHLTSYLEDYNKDLPVWKKYAQFLNLWARGLLSPQTYIAGESWDSFFGSLNQMVSLFLNYKQYIVGYSISRPEVFVHLLKSLNYFVSALSYVEVTNYKSGFPISNLDQMLTLMIAVSKDQITSFDFISILKDSRANPIPLFTRGLACFILKNKESSKACSYQMGKSPSPSLEYHFPDGTFKLYQDRQEWLPTLGSTFNITPSQMEFLKIWLSEYIKNYELLSTNEVPNVATLYQFDHWVTPSFGEDEGDSRIIFYPFNSSIKYKWPYRLLTYRFLSNLLLTSYTNDTSYNLSFKHWKQIVDELWPLLLAFKSPGYDLSLRQPLRGLFNYADYFLNSSNQDKQLDQREVLDLTVHLMLALESSEYAYHKIQSVCVPQVTTACASLQIFTKDVMKSFPRIQVYLLNYGSKLYKEATQQFLAHKSLTHSSDLIDVFLVLQMLEVQFQKLDINKNIRLEDIELLQMAQMLSTQIVYSIPYIKNQPQALSFILYSFKTGQIPFLDEGHKSFHSLDFVDWHMNHRADKFNISKGDLYAMVLKFYKLYRNQL